MSQSTPNRTRRPARARSAAVFQTDMENTDAVVNRLGEFHHELASRVCNEPTPLTGNELDFLCALIGMSQDAACRALRTDSTTLTEWKESIGIPLKNSLEFKEQAWKILMGRTIDEKRNR